MHTHLHSEVQSCVSILALQVGVGSVCEQHHGRLEASPLGQNVERALSGLTEVVHRTAVLQQQTTHLAKTEEDLFKHLFDISPRMLHVFPNST